MPDFTPKELARRALYKAVAVQQTVVKRHVNRVRSAHPDASPREIVVRLEWEFLRRVTAMGVATGASASVPAVTTGPALAANLADVTWFFEAASLFTLAVAEVHGVEVDDLERRRTLLMAVLMGESGARVVERAAGRMAPHWGKAIVRAVPMSTIHKVNRVLGPRFVTKYGTKQGILVLGRMVPLGIGAAIGGGGNALLARAAIAGARSAFGPAPATWLTSHDG